MVELSTYYINISVKLHTLPPLKISDHGDGNVYSTVCDVYAIVKEESIGASTTLCGRQNRRSHVYTSITNTVQISFVPNDMDDENYFFIEYEGKPINWATALHTYLFGFITIHSSVHRYTYM